jgi:diadenosine tetraphosphatase ApaH/serine/threonine PP2A family protein phosphatase
VSAHGSFDWLSELPLDVRITAEDGTRVLGVHASPGRDDGEGVYPDQPEDELRKSFAGCDADLVFVGHTHVPIDRVMDGVRIVNPGSVSNHLGLDVTAKWALLETSSDTFKVMLRRVRYDNDAVIDALERSRHPGRAYLARFMRGEMEVTWPFGKRSTERSARP